MLNSYKLFSLRTDLRYEKISFYKKYNAAGEYCEVLARQAKELLAARDNINAVVDDNGRIFPLTKHALYREMIRGSRQSGVKKIRVHDLRHPYVKHTTKIFSLRLKFFQAHPVPDALRKTRGASQYLWEVGNHIPFPRCINKKLPCGLCCCAGASGVWLS